MNNKVKILLCSENIKQVCLISCVRKFATKFQFENMLYFMPIIYVLSSILVAFQNFWRFSEFICILCSGPYTGGGGGGRGGGGRGVRVCDRTRLAGQHISNSCSFSPETEITPLILTSNSFASPCVKCLEFSPPFQTSAYGPDVDS